MIECVKGRRAATSEVAVSSSEPLCCQLRGPKRKKLRRTAYITRRQATSMSSQLFICRVSAVTSLSIILDDSREVSSRSCLKCEDKKKEDELPVAICIISRPISYLASSACRTLLPNRRQIPQRLARGEVVSAIRNAGIDEHSAISQVRRARAALA